MNRKSIWVELGTGEINSHFGNCKGILSVEAGLESHLNSWLRFAAPCMNLTLSGSCPLFNLQNCTPVEDKSIARGYADLLRHWKFDPIARALDPRMANLSPRNTLAEEAGTDPAKKVRCGAEG